jgi:hypothetical protein
VPAGLVEIATVGLEFNEATTDDTLTAPAALEPEREVASRVALDEDEGDNEYEDLDDYEEYSDLDDYAPVLEGARGPRRFVITAPAVVLTALVTSVFLMFLLIEPSPRWIVLFGTGLTTLAFDGVLRAGRREAFEAGGLDTTPQLLVPALYVLTMPVFIEHNSLGYWSALAGLAAGAGYGALVVGALSSVRELDEGRVAGRFIVTAATYVVAFSMFSLVFLFGVGQTPATIAVGLVATLLAAEILREGEIDPGETLLYSLVTGLVIAETRWLVHYLPVQGYAAALILLLAFYLVTGLLHSHVVRQLSSRVAAEYASVGALGAAFIAGLRIAGLA